MEKEINLTPATTEVKMEVDHSAMVDEKLPLLEALAKTDLAKGIEELISLEKQTRIGGDMLSTGRILVTIIRLCFDAKKWELLNENINMLAKRRGQLKGAVVKMVGQGMEYIDTLPTKELKYQLIDTLRAVTEGKIYVECERARLTYTLAKMKEAEGDIVAAANFMQELQVETYGSMERTEKVELILEQMRYCLAKNDYIRTQIISKKINVKFFDTEETHQLKMKFYRLMVEMDQHEGNYLNICRHYRAMLVTPKEGILSEDERKELLKNAVVYNLLSPFDNEQSDLLHRLLADKLVEHILMHKTLLERFKNQELINWTELCGEYEAELRKDSNIFDQSEFGLKRWKTFKDRVVEHNIRIMAKYYTRVSLTRMSQLLDLQQEEVELFLCNMITSGTVTGRIDRPSGVVSFLKTKDPSEALNEWANNLDKLMGLISNATHLINKEEMVHRHLNTGPSSAGPSQASSSTAVANQ